MKRLKILTLLILISGIAMGQYPTPSNLGADSTVVNNKGGFTTKTLQIPNYADTSTMGNRVKQYSGSIISVGDSLFFRNHAKTGWVKLGIASGTAITGWLLNGNLGSGNFLGTLDNTPLIFKTNNLLSGKIDPPENNVSMGYLSSPSLTAGLGRRNSAYGNTSLSNATSGTDNSVFGYNAGKTIQTGSNNISIGSNSDMALPTTHNSISIGTNSIASSNQLGFSSDIQSIYLPGIPSGTGYVLTDIAGTNTFVANPASSFSGWGLSGNSGLNASTNFMGTTDDIDVPFRRQNVEAFRIGTGGNIGVGTTTPNGSAILDIASTTKGVRISNMTGAQRVAISPIDGLLAYQTNSNDGNKGVGLFNYQTASWKRFLTDTDSTTLSAVGDSAFTRDNFDTSSRVLTMYRHNGTNQQVVIPRGTASGASGITALSSNITTDTLSISGDNGSTTKVALYTTNVYEGTNQYLTTPRVRTLLSVAKTPLSYNNTTGVFDFDSSNWHSSNYYNTIYQTIGGGGWSVTGQAVSNGNYFGSSNNRSVVFKTNGINAGTMDSLGNWGFGNIAPSSAYKIDVTGNINISNGSAYYMTNTTGVNRNSQFGNISTQDNNAVSYYYPPSGTAVSSTLHAIPKGTGNLSLWYASQFGAMNTDYYADNSNWNGVFLAGWRTANALYSYAQGTETVKPIAISATGTHTTAGSNFIANVDGTVSLPQYTANNSVLYTTSAGLVSKVTPNATAFNAILMQNANGVPFYGFLSPADVSQAVFGVNGLYDSVGRVGLGGTLYKNTTINGVNHTLTFTNLPLITNNTINGLDINGGFNTYGVGVNSVSLGTGSTHATSSYSIAIGHDVINEQDSAIAIGWGAGAGLEGAIAIGNHTVGNDANTIAIGQSAYCRFEDGIAIGTHASSYDDRSIAIGKMAFAGDPDDIAIGANANTPLGHFNQTAIGSNAATTGDSSIAIGTNAGSAVRGVAIGANSRAASHQIVLGTTNETAFVPGASISVGTTGTSGGTLKLLGSTSGTATIKVAAVAGNPQFTLPTNVGSANQVMTTDGTGVLSFVSPTVPISSLLAAISDNSIDNKNFQQSWLWTTLTGGATGLAIADASTGVTTGYNLFTSQTVGANSTSGQITKAAAFENDRTGTTSTNIAAQFNAINGTKNYAIIVPSGGGKVGIGTSTPDSTLQVSGGLKFVTGRQGAGKVLISDANGGADWGSASAGMVYPSAGIANSTGSAWGTSYTTTGTGTVLAAQTSPLFVTPRLNSTSTTDYVWTATDGSGNGSFQELGIQKALNNNNVITDDATQITWGSNGGNFTWIPSTERFQIEAASATTTMRTIWDGTGNGINNTVQDGSSVFQTTLNSTTWEVTNTSGVGAVGVQVISADETTGFVGINLRGVQNVTKPTSTLQVKGSFACNYVSTGINYNILSTDCNIITTSGGVVATLPTAVGITGREYTIINTSTSASVATTSSQTINGSTTYSLSAQYKYVTVISNGSNYYIKANN